METSCRVLFGRGHLPISLPAKARATIIRKAQMVKLAHPREEIGRALAAPINSKPFRELVRGRSSACILICDITRPVPNHLFLRPMIEEMLAGGIPRDRITGDCRQPGPGGYVSVAIIPEGPYVIPFFVAEGQNDVASRKT